MKRRTFVRDAGVAAGAWLLRPAAAAADQRPAVSGLPAPADPQFWSAVRRQFQLPRDVAYLNTAGLGASPLTVTDTVKAWMDREEQHPAPGHSEEDWIRIRGTCAALLGPNCSANEVAFVSTATEGLNAILNTVTFERGDQVITSTHEHAGLVIPLLHKIQTAGIEVRTFEPDLKQARGNVDRIAALVTPRTRLIILSHITCTTGQVMPVADIGRLAASRHITFALDGAQSLGHLPFDITDTGAQFYAASCHKWLMAPKRTGLLYVRKDIIPTTVPTVVGAYSDASSSLPDRTLVLRPGAQRFEYGTQNDALIYGLEAAVGFVNAVGFDRIWLHNRRLADRAVEGLASIAGVEMLSPIAPESRSAIITFHVPGRDNRQLTSELIRRRLRVRSVTEAGLDAVRASFHVCNDEDEVTRLLNEVRTLVS